MHIRVTGSERVNLCPPITCLIVVKFLHSTVVLYDDLVRLFLVAEQTSLLPMQFNPSFVFLSWLHEQFMQGNHSIRQSGTLFTEEIRISSVNRVPNH